MTSECVVTFEDLESSPAFAKIGIYGEAGSGKTTTAVLIALGLHKLIKSTKPIVFMDTETGSEFAKVLFKKANVSCKVVKQRSFETLLQIIPEATKISDILIIDSISHPYQDMMQSYLAKTKKKRLAFQDWNVLKPTFRKFTDAYVREKLHIIICGRSQGIWDYFKQDDGHMELHQIGTKMKVEKEMGYEPSLLIEMEKAFRENGKGWIHKATVLKDRNPDKATTLDGKSFDDPTFENILPHINAVNIGGKHTPVDTKDSQGLFEDESGRPDWQIKEGQRQIAMEEVFGFLSANFPSSSGDDKLAKTNLSLYLFSTYSKTELEKKSTEDYREALEKAKGILSIPENLQVLMTKKADLSKLKMPKVKAE